MCHPVTIRYNPPVACPICPDPPDLQLSVTRVTIRYKFQYPVPYVPIRGSCNEPLRGGSNVGWVGNTSLHTTPRPSGCRCSGFWPQDAVKGPQDAVKGPLASVKGSQDSGRCKGLARSKKPEARSLISIITGEGQSAVQSFREDFEQSIFCSRIFFYFLVAISGKMS